MYKYIYKFINICIHIHLYIYSKLPISRTRKGPKQVSDLARCPTYPRFIQNIMQIIHEMRRMS